MPPKEGKRPGEPLVNGDPAWVMNLNGKNRSGFYIGVGSPGFHFVGTSRSKWHPKTGPGSAAGWWVDRDLYEIRHRNQGDDIDGAPPADSPPDHGVDDMDPLNLRNLGLDIE